MSKLKRVSFGSHLGVILATAGSAVGLGNVWRFPYMTLFNFDISFLLIIADKITKNSKLFRTFAPKL